MKDLQIVELGRGSGEEMEWQRYVGSVPNASMYHSIEWRDILSHSFGHKTRYLMAREGGVVRGVLPLVEMQSPLFGHFFVSLPFLNYGGILADTPGFAAALAASAIDIAMVRGARHIELRQSFPEAACEKPLWHQRQHKAALVISIDANPETHWAGLSSRLRGKIRKSEKAGSEFRVGGPELLDDFYRVFALNMRDLGTPVHSSAFFRNVLRIADDAKVLMAYHHGKPASGAIALRRGSRIELPWICSDYSQSQSNVNEYLYWNAIRWACTSGGKALDLGRSSIDAGTYRFKLQWNPKVQPLNWYYWLASGIELPELNPNNPKYAFAISCWKRLPVAVANKVGPSIVRHIP